MTKIDELVELLAEVDDHCANTFCNTCQYQQMSDEYPCSFYAIAQKLIDEGYEKVNKTKKKTTIEEFAEKLKNKLFDYFQNNEKFDGNISVGSLYVDVIGVEAEDGTIISLGLIDKLLKEYENE